MVRDYSTIFDCIQALDPTFFIVSVRERRTSQPTAVSLLVAV